MAELREDYAPGEILKAADVNAITTTVNGLSSDMDSIGDTIQTEVEAQLSTEGSESREIVKQIVTNELDDLWMIYN